MKPRLKPRGPMGNRYIPVTVQVTEGEHAGTYQVHKGRPGRPRVYRAIGGSLLRLYDGHPALTVVATAMRDGVDRRRAEEQAEWRRRATWHFRIRRWIGGAWARVVALVRGQK